MEREGNPGLIERVVTRAAEMGDRSRADLVVVGLMTLATPAPRASSQAMTISALMPWMLAFLILGGVLQLFFRRALRIILGITTIGVFVGTFFMVLSVAVGFDLEVSYLGLSSTPALIAGAAAMYHLQSRWLAADQDKVPLVGW